MLTKHTQRKFMEDLIKLAQATKKLTALKQYSKEQSKFNNMYKFILNGIFLSHLARHFYIKITNNN